MFLSHPIDWNKKGAIAIKRIGFHGCTGLQWSGGAWAQEVVACVRLSAVFLEKNICTQSRMTKNPIFIHLWSNHKWCLSWRNDFNQWLPDCPRAFSWPWLPDSTNAAGGHGLPGPDSPPTTECEISDARITRHCWDKMHSDETQCEISPLVQNRLFCWFIFQGTYSWAVHTRSRAMSR